MLSTWSTPGRAAARAGEGGIERAAAEAAAGRRRRDVEVGVQRVVEPADDGRAEAPDHHPDPHRHRDRDDQRGDGDAGAAERRDHAARRHPPEDAEERSHRPPEEAHHDDRRRRRQDRAADDHREEGDEGEDEAAADEEQAAAGGEEEGAGRHGARQRPAQARLERRAGEDGARRRRGRLVGGGDGRQERRADPHRGALGERRRRDRQAAHGEDEVEVVDRLGDQADEAAAEGDPGEEAGAAPDDRHRRRLGEHQGEHLAAGDAQGAESAEESAPLDDRESDGVVDEEDAADEGEERERRQVEAEGAGHRLGRARARRGGDDRGAGRQHGAGARQPAVALGAGGEDQVDAGEAAEPPGHLLRRRHVDHQEVGERPPRGVVERRDGADDGHRDDRAAETDRQLAADGDAQLARRRRREDGGARAGEEGRQVEPGAAAREVRAERLLGEGVDPQQVEEPAAPAAVSKRRAGEPAGGVGQAGGAERDGDVLLDDRRGALDPGGEDQAAVGVVREPFGAAQHLMGGAPGDRLGREGEGAGGAGVGEVDGDDHRHPERHAEDGEADLRRVAGEVAQARPPEDRRPHAVRAAPPGEVGRKRSIRRQHSRDAPEPSGRAVRDPSGPEDGRPQETQRTQRGGARPA